MRAIVNHDRIMKKILKSQKVQKQAYSALEARFINAKTSLLNEFDESDVTQELKGGAYVTPSAVLPNGYGNLYSFLGFAGGIDPTIDVREQLDRIVLLKTPQTTARYWVFRIKVPSKDDLDKVSAMHWEAGRSWIDAVTYGLGGFSFYMFSLTRGRFKHSRSGTGIQSPHLIRNSASYFTGVGYVLGMLGKFNRKLKR